MSLASSRSWPLLLPVLSQGLGGEEETQPIAAEGTTTDGFRPWILAVSLLWAVSSSHGGAWKRITSTYQGLPETVILPRWSVPNKRSVSQ